MASYIIGDVHGCYYSMLALLDKISPSTSDKIYFIGDLINKGKFSRKLVDQIIQWKQEGWNIEVIRGNHEEKLLSLEGVKSKTLIAEFTDWYSGHKAYQEFYNQSSELEDPYRQFFLKTNYFIELDEYFLVHAGFNCKRNQAFIDRHAMTTIRNWSGDYDPRVLKGKVVIHGHQSVSLRETQKAADNENSKTIPIDNGCVYYGAKTDRGYLTAVRLEDRAVFSVINMDDWLFTR